MNNKTTYTYNKQTHDEAIERCQSNKELYDFAHHLFTNLTEKHEDWNEFAIFYNHDVVEYVNEMFNIDFEDGSYDSNDIEAVVEQLYDFLDDWNVNWFNEDWSVNWFNKD